MHIVKYLCHWMRVACAAKWHNMFSLHSCYLIFTFFMFSGIGCVFFANEQKVPFFLIFSSASLCLIHCFRVYGFYIVSSVFLGAICSQQLLPMEPLIWRIGIVSTFLLSWGIFAFTLASVDQFDREQQSKRDQYEKEQEQKYSVYEAQLKEHEDRCRDLDRKHNVLQDELQQVRLQLNEVNKQKENLAEDLQILSDQKTSWMADYAELHNQYIKLMSDGGAIDVFSFVPDDRQL